MQYLNFTDMAAAMMVCPDQHGYEHLVAIVKGSYSLTADGALRPLAAKPDVMSSDVHRGAPGRSSVLYASDHVLCKQACDVVLNGRAWAPGGRPVDVVEVTLEMSTIRKTLRVFGERGWTRGALGRLCPSAPIPFQSIEMTWERSFGGEDTSDQDPKSHRYEPRNLVGVGLRTRARPDEARAPLPNIEDPREPISSTNHATSPVGFGHVARGWQPRLKFAGTYDDRWKRDRFPFLPVDFDERFFQVAPLDQQIPIPRGGELVRLHHLTREGLLEFRLPVLEVPVEFALRGGTERVLARLDTIVLEPDLSRVLLTWRASVRCRGKPTDIGTTVIGEPTSAYLRARRSGKRYVHRLGGLVRSV